MSQEVLDKVTTVIGAVGAITGALGASHVISPEMAEVVGSISIALLAYFTNRKPDV